MRERKGTVGRITGVAEGLAAAVRRRQYDRTPRVLLYDRAGHPRVLAADDPERQEIVAAAARLIALAVGGPAEQVAAIEAVASGTDDADADPETTDLDLEQAPEDAPFDDPAAEQGPAVAPDTDRP